MKIKKRILCPERLRRIPGQFSWIDQRLQILQKLQQQGLPVGYTVVREYVQRSAPSRPRPF